MGLIDADEFKKQEVLEKLRTAEFDDEIEDVIEKVPITYELDKVIEQLNKEYTDAIKMLNDDRGTALEFAAEVRCDSYKRAIEIVKAGGANED